YPLVGKLVHTLPVQDYTLFAAYDGNSYLYGNESIQTALTVEARDLPPAQDCGCDDGEVAEASGTGRGSPSTISSAGVSYVMGTLQISRSDLMMGGSGPSWGTQWSYTNADGFSDGLSGSGAAQQMPRLIELNGTFSYALLLDSQKPIYFDYYDSTYHV